MASLNFDRSLAFVGIISAIILVVLDKAGKLKGPVLFVLLAIAAGMTVPLVFSLQWVAHAEGPQRLARCALMVCLVGVAYSLLCVWISGDMKGQTGGFEAENHPQGPDAGPSELPPTSSPKLQVPQTTERNPSHSESKTTGAHNPSNPRPKQSTPSQAMPSDSTPRDKATFKHLTAIGGGTAILDCDPLVTFDDVLATTTSKTQPAVDVGSSRCDNQESFIEYDAYRQLKSNIARDAGSTKLVKADLGSLKAELRELRKPEHEAEHRPEGYWEKLNQEFDQMENAFLAVADDKQKTLDLLSRLKITGR